MKIEISTQEGKFSFSGEISEISDLREFLERLKDSRVLRAEFHGTMVTGSAPVTNFPWMNEPPPPPKSRPIRFLGFKVPSPKVREYWECHNKIDAIKQYREDNQVGLKDSKEFLEYWFGG